MRAFYIFCLVATPLVAALAACKPVPSSPISDAASPRDAARDSAPPVTSLDGPAIYGTLCAVCHAPDATGYKADNAPSLVNRTFLESASDEQIRKSIVEGRPGTSMAPYGKERGGPLDADGMAKVVAWLRNHGPAALSLPARGVGDATRGAPLFVANCERCHGN